MDIDASLADNDAYHALDRLGDLVRTGPTDTNVGDLQVLVIGDRRTARVNALHRGRAASRSMGAFC